VDRSQAATSPDDVLLTSPDPDPHADVTQKARQYAKKGHIFTIFRVFYHFWKKAPLLFLHAFYDEQFTSQLQTIHRSAKLTPNCCFVPSNWLNRYLPINLLATWFFTVNCKKYPNTAETQQFTTKLSISISPSKN
jgi:hypothetical protein